MSMDGRGLRDGWMTFKLPTWLVGLLVVIVVLILVAVIASPELAAKLGVFISQWFAVQNK